MRSGPWRLRTQLSLSMICVALTALGVFIIGMIAFYVTLQTSWLASLSHENRATLHALIEDKTVSSEALTTLVSAFSLSWSGTYEQAELAALSALVLLATLTAIFGGIVVARKLSAPIEGVTRAVLKVADGNIRQEVSPVAGGSSETEDLVAAFRSMVQSLDQAERDATDSSAAIAHELRTPLTILRGRLQGLGDGTFAPSEEMTDGLIAQVDTLSRIVDELSFLSRLSSGHFTLQCIDINLADEVSRVITTVRPDMDSVGMILDVSLDPVVLHADPVRVRQALSALLDNARRYAESGRYVKISTFAAGSFGYLQVRDHGPGIEQGDHDRVFERWWRGDKSRNRTEGGTGLGLAVVRAITRAHRGEASVRDLDDRSGAEFVLKFPLQATGEAMD